MAEFGNVNPQRALAEEIIDAADTRKSSTLAERLLEGLEGRAAAGCEWAEAALHQHATDGARRYMTAILKYDDRSRVKIARTGEVVGMPSRIGTPVRDENGKAQRAHQYELWWEAPWEWVAEFIESLSRQAQTMTRRAVALSQVLDLRERHPDTVTPGEACEREGIDPRSYDIEAA